ncbi:PREDICTED: uncharacterized protein LOC105450304 [Wasmannia auropunctata]|uniref:uncharacterized protein LOC105450304 n=1 Tax=Wasmannia auropunctata TaxID=64793 RepID=UPI0005F09907|nr:PREDICTED: uncharacterized protein LOC105450304 [Wasmannia auropunctata]
MGIEGLRNRRALTGALVLEIPGPNREEQAKDLAARLTTLLAGKEGVDVAEAVASLGGCAPEELSVGAIRLAPNGLGTAWLRCPLRVAQAAAKTSRVTVGWARCRVEVLPARPLQCFRCHLAGHVGAACGSRDDRSDCCYKCGRPGHVARDCAADKPDCPICRTKGKPAEHRVGSKACPASRRAKGRRGQAPVRTPTATVVASPAGGEMAGMGEPPQQAVENMEVTMVEGEHQ